MRILRKDQPLWDRLLIVLIVTSLGFAISGCGVLPISEAESARRTQLRETELEISVKQTLLFEQSVNQSIELTAKAESKTTPPSLIVEETVSPPSVSPTSSLPVASESSPVLEPSATKTIDEAAFNSWMQNAKILLYEDMTARLDTFRYVKTALSEMRLTVKDDGSAFGWLLDDLKNGPKDGGQWDLIILAAEDKNGPQADFFSMALEAVSEGISVILEVWYINNTANSSAKELLTNCGIEYENNWIKIPPSGLALYPLSHDHPILNEPNKISGFTKSTNYWWDPSGAKAYDIGDMVKLAPNSSATLLLGTIANTNTAHATSTVCMDEKLILQSFSSHALDFSIMSPLWQNYIYHALQTRFISLN